MKCLEYRYDRYLRAYHYRELEKRGSTLTLAVTGEPAPSFIDARQRFILSCASFEAGRETLRQRARDNGLGECRLIKEDAQPVYHAESVLDFVINNASLS